MNDNDLMFRTTITKEALSLILTKFFQTMGYIDSNMNLELELLEMYGTDSVYIEGAVQEETVN